MSAINRRQLLRALYGFDFPDDLFRFWEFASRLRPLEPSAALESIGVHLVGPFDVLSGRFDRHRPRLSPLLHWRYHDDPPEFFTVLAGTRDGLHWGCYLDDPGDGDGCIASYFARGAFEISTDGETLFEAVRWHLEQHVRDLVEMGDDTAAVGAVGRIRERLMAYGTGDRAETEADYEERYPPQSQRERRVIAATRDGMGVVAPGDTYRPLSLADRALWRHLKKSADPAELVDEARRALADGYPATALKLGKDLWAIGGERHTDYACELLDAAYEALHRPTLRAVLAAHRANRDLPSVDIFEMEEGV